MVSNVWLVRVENTDDPDDETHAVVGVATNVNDAKQILAEALADQVITPARTLTIFGEPRDLPEMRRRRWSDGSVRMVPLGVYGCEPEA